MLEDIDKNIGDFDYDSAAKAQAKEKTIAYMSIWRTRQATRGDMRGLPAKPPHGSSSWAVFFCDHCSNNKFHTTLQCPYEFEYEHCTFQPALDYYKSKGLTRDRNVKSKDLYSGDPFDYQPYRDKHEKSQGSTSATSAFESK